MKKESAYAALALLAALLVLAGCEGPEGPQGIEGNRGLNLWEGPFSFSINNGESSEPLTDLGEFSTALIAALAALPEDAGTDPDDPVKLKVNGLTLSETEQLYVLYGAISRYVDLDLSGCKGTMVAAVSVGLYQENKENILSLILPNSITALETGSKVAAVFMNFTSLVSLSMPGGTFAGRYALSGCTSLETLTIPHLVSIEEYALQSCSGLKTLDFPELLSIDGYALLNCNSLESVNFPKLVSIGTYAFQNCTSLGNASFPALASIGIYGFRGCAILERLTLPGLENIGNYAFYGCTSLAEITLGETPPATVGSGIFQSTGGTTSSKKQITLKVPTAKTGDYETWKSSNSAKLNSTTVDLNVTGI
jgi:hypothetical protein